MSWYEKAIIRPSNIIVPLSIFLVTNLLMLSQSSAKLKQMNENKMDKNT